MEYQDFSKISDTQYADIMNGRASAEIPQAMTFDEAWARIQAGSVTAGNALEERKLDVQELIEQAKVRLAATGTKTVDGEKVPTVEAEDKATVKQIHALAEEAKRARDEASAQYELYKQVLKDLTGENEALTVNGVPVFTYKRSTTTILNQAAIKAQFPQATHPELYTEQERRTALIK
jgi:hypothetical protein